VRRRKRKVEKIT